MANRQPNNGKGPRNGQGGPSGQENFPPRHITRPFTLQEALPYTPQTAVFPFIPDIIPEPSIGAGTPAVRLSEFFPSDQFDGLNKEAEGQDETPKSVQQAVDLILQELKPHQRTQFNFLPVRREFPDDPNIPKIRSLTENLSPITRGVFDSLSSFLTPAKPEQPAESQAGGKQPAPTAKSPNTSKPNFQNAQAQRSNNSKIEIAIPGKKKPSMPSSIDAAGPTPPIKFPSTPQQYPPLHTQRHQLSTQQMVPAGNPGPHSSTKHGLFSVELRAGNINPDEYAEYKEQLETPLNLSVHKGTQPGFADSQDLIGESVDQRQRSEAALDSLNKQLQTVFSAVGHVLAHETGYDHIAVMTPDQEATLTAAIQQKIHSAIQKAIALGCYERVPVEDLVRVMRLSDGSLKQAQDLDMNISEDWSEDAVEAWVQQLSLVEMALKAARTCLRILSGGREDKQLYSETVIRRIVDIFKSVTENIVAPLVEFRASGTSANVFKMLSKQKKMITPIFICCQKLFAALAELVTKIELSDQVITSLECIASLLVFAENAHSEKDSVIGVQKLDGIRSVAMDMLCQIYLVKPQQRQGIIDDILTSLEKLPVGKQSARQFKLSDGRSIQPVSALIMRLVQASSGRVDNSKERNRSAMLRQLQGDDGGNGADDGHNPPSTSRNIVSCVKSEEQGAQQPDVAVKELETAAAPLMDTAQRNASYVINFIVTRALGSTKSGDAPYRNLLDLFAEDFTTCLDSPDWPSAELLLRLLMVMMVQVFEGPKTAAPAKNMALEFLGSMVAAISRLRSHVKKMATSLEGSDSDELSRYLFDLADLALEQKNRMDQMVAWAGPYRATLEYVQHRCTDDPHLWSAISYTIADWASRLHGGYDNYHDDNEERDKELGRLAYRLRMMIEDRRWLLNEYTFKSVSVNQAKLSYAIILLRSQFCESLGKIFNLLLGSMANDQATVRSKSLKSVSQVLETDPTILDGDSLVIKLIVDCTSDSSTQVRDSALGLLGSCIGLRPNLENSLTYKIIDRLLDTGVGVRKRAMKLARDVYLRNRSKALRSVIANGLLRRVQDPDEGVRDLARQMIEEVWFAPFYFNENTAAYQTALTEHVALVIQTVKTGTVTEILDKVFGTILKPQNKSLEGPFSVCSKIVARMFDLIDNLGSEEPDGPSGREALQVLTIFAKADPKLFTLEQIRLLEPHLASWDTPDDLAAFRAVTVIYRRVLPQLTAAHHSDFLGKIRKRLVRAVGKTRGRGVVDDLIACTKVVCELLHSFEPLSNVLVSSLSAIRKLPRTGLTPAQIKGFSAYTLFVGAVGKHADLTSEMSVFKRTFGDMPFDSVPRLVVEILTPFTSPTVPLEVRRAALEAMCSVCASWPRNYVLIKVYTAFQQVFDERVPKLEAIILLSFKEFLLTEERLSEAAAEAPANEKKKKELAVMGGTSFDDVASATTQRFLKDITRIALGSQDEFAFLAMELLGSINRQGLTHPKETGITLITLETSMNRKIAELAYIEHRALHEKHETVLEREYAKAVQSAYNYQRDVVKDIHGATTNPFQAKLHLLMEVLKISKMKNRQRFLEKLCRQVDFDIAQLDVRPEVPPHMGFSQFIIENLAYFEYQTIGELQTTVHTIEKIVTHTGATVAQAIESEVFNVRMDVDQPVEASQATNGEGPNGERVQSTALTVDDGRLRQLAAASIILLSMWEARTHLRRLYGMGTNRHDSKAKALAKELNKTPVKVQSIHMEKLWDEVSSHMNGLQSREQMVEKCRIFVELLNVDKEFKVTEDAERMDVDDAETPSEDEEGEGAADRGRKRKSGAGTPGGRKKKQRSSSQPRKRGRPRKQSVEQDVADAAGEGDWI